MSAARVLADSIAYSLRMRTVTPADIRELVRLLNCELALHAMGEPPGVELECSDDGNGGIIERPQR